MALPSTWNIFNPDAPPRTRRPLRVDPPVVHEFPSLDGTMLRLTRYQGGSRGPVLLSHCIGVSSLMYATDTIEPNLLEYLYARQFDVWLLDFRFSIELPASRDQSTMDDVATRDYPAAVARVRELAGTPTVQVVAHGVGSSTFSMALLAGLEGVRSAVCSQVSTHLLVPTSNRIKTGLCLSEGLAALGLKHLTAYTDSRARWPSRLYDRSLALYPLPKEERCDSPVCRRITSIYGPLYEHDQLGAATHQALHELFGVVNIRALKQLSLITRKHHLVNAAGEEVYLPNVKRMGLPIAFIHGDENDCVLPVSTETTYDLVTQANGPGRYTRHLVPGYGHVDCIIGERAHRDVYPLIADHLESTQKV